MGVVLVWYAWSIVVNRVSRPRPWDWSPLVNLGLLLVIGPGGGE